MVCTLQVSFSYTLLCFIWIYFVVLLLFLMNRKFAPIFISIAEKITSRIQVLNQEYPQHPYSNIHFYAVDCAMYKKICDANRVEYYPVVLPINFPNSNESNKFIEGIETDIYQYLKATIFQVRVRYFSSLLFSRSH